GVEVAVLEVGLVGRFDATTVGRPAVSVLGPIDLDHREFLGDALEDIAREKAAIIRSGIAVTAAQAPAAQAILEARAAEVGVPLLREGHELAVEVLAADAAGQRLTCRGPGWTLADLEIRLAGAYQPGNALLAVTAARELGAPEAAIRAGLARARWPGRFQVIAGEPTLVLDGAHNPAGARALAASLARVFPGRAVTLVIGVLRDKDARGIVAALTPVVRRWIVTAPSSRRALPATDLAGRLPPGVDVRVAATVGEALGMATRPVTTPIVCVAGSLTVIGEALRTLGNGDKPCPVEKGADSMESLYW
ncbi:MAG: dihydrofolate synthase, partial [Candidatus Rokubacteria bacterium]|nr:dihydrofolate synthase [Candidatus Rokubacteria bacterium]